MTTYQPPLLMAHIDLGIGPNISMCVQGVGAYVCLEKIFLTMNVIDRQTHTKHNNIANIIYKYGQNKRQKGKRNINKEEVTIKTLHSD